MWFYLKFGMGPKFGHFVSKKNQKMLDFAEKIDQIFMFLPGRHFKQ